MKSFTMIPDQLMTIRLRGCKGSKPAIRRIIVAYLIRAYGFPKLDRWNDLTISQIAKWTGLSRQKASAHFNHIVENWVDEFLPIVENVEGYRGLDFPGFYRFIQEVRRRAKTKVPKHPMCAKSNPHVLRNVTDRCYETEHYKNVRRLRRLKTNDDRLYSIQPLVKNEPDGRDRGETERMKPSEVSTSSAQDRGRRAESEPTDDDWIRRMEL